MGAGQGGDVGGVLGVASVEDHRAALEGERGDGQKADDPARDDDEDLAALAVATATGGATGPKHGWTSEVGADGA